MAKQDDKIQVSTGSTLHAPPDEVLREAVRHDNEDLTIQSPAGNVRLASGSEAWTRYKGYLEERKIDPKVEEPKNE